MQAKEIVDESEIQGYPLTPTIAKNTIEVKPSLLVSSSVEGQHRDAWRIALYYVYMDLHNLQEHVCFHRSLCEKLGLRGRLRISAEGINGVLSGLHAHLLLYQEQVTVELSRLAGATSSTSDCTKHMEESTIDTPPFGLDVKYCLLRDDLPVDCQLFDDLIVKETKTVISLFNINDRNLSKKERRRRRKEDLINNPINRKDPTDFRNVPPGFAAEVLCKQPSTHLTASQWNEKLSVASSDRALLLDVRNVYESRVGRFETSQVPTLLTNTRKYSDLPTMIAENETIQTKQEIYMYCTGGVRCERVSQLVQTLYPEKKVYQLGGGIQTYLRTSEPEENLYQGKNFVFDPRRTDPVFLGERVGTCLMCDTIHDDYDNGHAPSEKKEARCNGCRMLILVCNACRDNHRCCGEDKHGGLPLLYCGVDRCVHEGTAPEPELLHSS